MLMCGGLLFAAVPASAGDGTQAVQEKTPAHPAKKWRVAYIEGGGYTDYQRILAATAKGLAELGVIADGDVPIPELTDEQHSDDPVELHKECNNKGQCLSHDHNHRNTSYAR